MSVVNPANPKKQTITSAIIRNIEEVTEEEYESSPKTEGTLYLIPED